MIRKTLVCISNILVCDYISVQQTNKVLTENYPNFNVSVTEKTS